MKPVWIGSKNEAVIAQTDAALQACGAALPVVAARSLSQPLDFPAGLAAGLLVLDTALPEADLARVLASVNRLPAAPPILFVSAEDSLDMRLKAARAGGAAFSGSRSIWHGLVKPCANCCASRTSSPIARC